jgi:ketosteroid isomerase-like protein
MTTEEVGQQLVALCSQGRAMDAINTLYAHDIVSVEATPMPDGSREMKGFDAVKGKSEWWLANHEVHSAKVEGPMVSDSRFCVRFVYDITNKPSGRRMVMDELGVYHVKDGKIAREEFFYGA